MITTEGKTYIKRYLAGWVPNISESIAFGVGGKAEAVGDTALQFEIGRSLISVVSFDFVNNKLIFKAPVPTNYGGLIYEVGIFSREFNSVAGIYGSRILSTFGSDTETWVVPSTGASATYSATNARIGLDGVLLSPAVSTASAVILNDLQMEFSGNSGTDRFAIAWQAGANLASLVLRMKTDASNYYTFTVTAPTAGYRVDTVTKGSATVTGAPNWSTINSMEVIATANATGAATALLDGIRIEDTDTINPDYVMVSRELLTTPFTKVEGATQEIEFSLDVAV